MACGEWAAGVREGLTEKLAFEQRLQVWRRAEQGIASKTQPVQRP